MHGLSCTTRSAGFDPKCAFICAMAFVTDAEFRAFFSRMDEADRRFFWVDNVNRAAVGHVNAERDFSLLCDEAIATAELLIGSPGTSTIAILLP